MVLNVADIKLELGARKRVPVEISLAPTEVGGSVVHFLHPLRGTAEAWNTGDSILVELSLEGEVQLECDCCLTAFTEPIYVEAAEEFREGSLPAGVEPGEPVEEEGRMFTYYQGDQIDLSEAIRQLALLELPLKAICSSECRGLCPTCGTNLNEGQCQCIDSSLDPRLAVLKDLLKDGKVD